MSKQRDDCHVSHLPLAGAVVLLSWMPCHKRQGCRSLAEGVGNEETLQVTELLLKNRQLN